MLEFGILLGSFWFFHGLRALVKGSSFFTPHSVRKQGRVTTWKWVNIVDSLVHSLVTGAGSLLCFYKYPETGTNVVSTYSPLAHSLTAFSIGYFLFDFGDMLLNHRKRSSYELMLHHAFVTSCFGVSLWSGRYLGFVMVALVIEVNSVFLHWRQLLILSNTPKDALHYRAVSVFNLLTFILFRVVTLAWMANWLATNGEKVPKEVHLLGCVATATVTVMSIILLQRVLKADFRTGSSTSSAVHGIKGN